MRSEPDFAYGGPLVEGINEMVVDFPLEVLDRESVFYVDIAEPVATMPDGRVLFAFEGCVGYRV